MEEIQKTETKEESKKQMTVVFDEKANLEFKNNEELSLAVTYMAANKMIPDHLKKEGMAACIAAVTSCKQFSLPFSAMNEMAYIRGKITFFSSLITALAERDPDYGDLKVFYIDKENNEISFANKNLNAEVYACVVQIKKRNSSVWNEFYFTMDEAINAGLTSNNTYKKYPKDMLFHRAKKRAFDTCYANAMKGVYSYELEKEYTEIKDVTENKADKLRESFGLDQPKIN